MKPRTLYLVRHAIAAERGPKYPDDNLRPLTKRGIEKMQEAARGFAGLEPAIDVVISSPLVRAKQTAEIVLAALSKKAGTGKTDSGSRFRAPASAVLEELAPGTAPADLADALEPYSKQRTIALVGHEPDLGIFAAWLIGASRPIPFKKGAIGCFEVADFPPTRTSTLLWLATPRMLRGL